MRLLSFLCVLVAWFAIVPPSFAAEDLCPQDSAAVKNVPGDVAGVQADIDRLNLCVERAKLLKQLDDIAKQRADTLNKLKNPTAGSGFSGGLADSLSGIAPLPLNALPELPAVKAAPLKSGEVRINKSSAKPLGGDDEPAQSDVVKKGNWKIRKIWGQAGGLTGAVMRAQLTDGSGALLNVVKGDPLPDGRIVDSVSIKGVTLASKGPKGIGKVDDLSWDDGADSASNPASAAPPSSDSKPSL